jgi:hypothetical protein
MMMGLRYRHSQLCLGDSAVACHLKTRQRCADHSKRCVRVRRPVPRGIAEGPKGRRTWHVSCRLRWATTA